MRLSTRTCFYASAVVLLGAGLAALRGTTITEASPVNTSVAAGRPELEYLKAVNRINPPHDPQLLFLLMAEYANANRQPEGAEFLSARLNEFAPRLTDVQKSLYLSAIALLRAQHAAHVPLMHRVGYVRDTLAMLEQARQLSGGQIFVVNWIAGIVHAQVPGFFRQRKAAHDELAWCVANIDKAPHAGWLREVLYQLAVLAQAEGDTTHAQQYLRQSGYPDFRKQITLITPLAESGLSGHTFSPRRIAEIVPGRVYALSGFEFTEFYFVVSEDKRQLIGIDAGTRPDSAKAAYESLRARNPGLPELTTIFVTHSHWDHIGGHAYFGSLNPRPRFYARSNYREEIAHDQAGPAGFARPFFGERFNMEDVRSFKPDATIDRRTEVTVGGTRFELIPVHGGETQDAMLISLPDQGVMFVGDFIMPYMGAPFVSEGDVQGLLDAIDTVVQEHPRYLLHGHELLTENFRSTEMLAQLRTDLAWLREQVLAGIQRGEERSTIYNANLIPPGLLAGNPDVYQPYLIMREHVIDRLYEQNSGYWQADLQGLDHLGRADRAELLVDYLGLSENQLIKAVNRLASDGKYELAASLLDSSRSRFEHSPGVAEAERRVYLKLMEKYQNLDPFKFILYSARIGEQTPQIATGR